MIEMVCSPLEWFEGRGRLCSEIVFIDGATIRFSALNFASPKTTKVNFFGLLPHSRLHGAPLAFCSDLPSIILVDAKVAQIEHVHLEVGRVAKRRHLDSIP